MRRSYAVAFLILILGSLARGDELRIALMTVGPGGRAYEKFGHNQIWVHDPADGSDIAYNYGVFDFEQENFIWRFIQGRMLYRCEAVVAAEVERAYREAYPELAGRTLSAGRWLSVNYLADERSVWVQELDLTAGQKRALADFLRWNARPENQEYRYDYYRDNCSTRVRDALDRADALGGILEKQWRGVASGSTYRSHTRRLTQMDLPLYAALYAALGQPVDAPIDRWEQAFLPMELMKQLRGVKVVDEAGGERPLVKREYELYRSPLYEEPENLPRFFWAGAMVIGLAGGGFLIGLGTLGRRWPVARWTAGGLIAVWLLLCGVSGSIGTWAYWTDHRVGWWNENWFQLNPVSLVLMVVGPWAMVRGMRSARVLKWAMGVSLVVLLLSVAGMLLQMLPWFGQVNGEVIAVALPVHVGVWKGLRQVAGQRRSKLPSGDKAGDGERA